MAIPVSLRYPSASAMLMWDADSTTNTVQGSGPAYFINHIENANLGSNAGRNDD